MTGFIRFTSVLAVIAVAIVCGWISWTHAYHVVHAHHEPSGLAAAYPLTIDGLVYSASMVLLDHARRGVSAPRLAKWVLGLGIFATGATNVWWGLVGGFADAVIALWPAISLVLSYEMLMFVIRGHAAEEAVADLPETVQDMAGTQRKQRRRHASGHPTPQAAEREFRLEIEAGVVPTIQQIKRRLQVGDRKARQYRDHFREVGRVYREQVTA